MPKVSLIMTIYNQEAFVAKAIRSVLDQSEPDWELIIWDDGSTDLSPEIASVYCQNEPRIRVVHARHTGRVSALASAMCLARAPYVGWIDGDDKLGVRALEATTAVLDRHPQIGLVYTDYADMNGYDQVLGRGARCAKPYSPKALLTDFMVFHFRLYRRSLPIDYGSLTPYAEDYDLVLRLSEKTRFHHLPQAHYFYRRHRGSTSHRHQVSQLLGARDAIEKALVRRGLSGQYQVNLKIKGHYALSKKDVL